jgi:methyl-galactoside transport system ATP-binding protein
MAETFALEMKHISKSFPGVKALDDVSFRTRPGTVHALMGENGAGKSTLMKCLFGIYSVDAGEVLIEGQPVSFENSKQALDHGISMIHQELLPVPHRSVMENLWLGRYPEKRFGPIRLIDHERMYRDTQKLFEELKIDVEPRRWVAELSVSKVQSIEIAKAVSRSSKIVIMDEPTSSLTEREVAHLFAIVRDLKARGVCIIYISHKMEEILTISDEVSIMRDGKLVGTYVAAELTTQTIISKMVGRDLTQRFPERANVPGDVRLRVENVSSADPKSFRDVSFELRAGEILGVGGLVGAQRTELVEALFGLRPLASGKLFLNGTQVQITSPSAAKRHRLALVTEDRRGTGLFPVLSVADNTLIANLKAYKQKTRLLDEKAALADAEKSSKLLRVRTPSLKALIRDLSGGNQQKVIFARWLLTDPEVLILDEPTRGVDVGAKLEIYTIIAELAKSGKSIILISSEMPELLGMSDRVMVMCAGRVTGILDGKTATQEQVMTLATQFSSIAPPTSLEGRAPPAAF